MARLPIPGSDDGSWGDILNAYLLQSLAADGSIRTGAVGSPQLADNAVTSAKLAPSAVIASHLSTGSVTNSAIADGAIAQGKIANLSGDLAGKAASVHTHTASQISDASTAGRSLMTAADAAAQRSALGLGSAATLTVGTTAGTVAAGDDSRLTGAQSAATLDADVAALVGDGGSDVGSGLSSTFVRRGVLTINVADYGTLDPTGATDNATPWQAALDAAATTTALVRVVAPPGTYLARNLLIGQYTWLDLDGVTIKHGGAKAGTTIEGSSATLHVNGTEGAPAYGVKITGGAVQGARINYTDITGAGGNDSIYLYWAPGAIVQGVTVTESGQDGITVDKSSGAQIIANAITNTGDAAVELRSGAGYIVRDNTMNVCRDGVATKYGLDRCIVTNNKITSFGDGILFHGTNWQILNNIIDVTSIPGESIDGTAAKGIFYGDQWSGTLTPTSSSDILIAGNRIDGRTNSDAIAIDTLTSPTTLTRVAITANIITNCKRGIRGSVGAGWAINNNTISTTEECVTLSADATNALIKGNTLTSTGKECVYTAVSGTQIVGNQLTCSAASNAAVRTGSAASNVQINSNSITATTHGGILVYGAGPSIVGNRVTASGGQAAIKVESTATNAVLQGNKVAGASGEGISIIASADGATVTGNSVTAGTQGLRLASNRCAVTGNRFTGATFWGVNISSGATNNMIVGNSLTGNTSGTLTDAGTGTTSANNITA